MKNWKLFVCLLSLVFFVLAGTACQQSGASNSATLRGAIHKEDNGTGLYILSGGKHYHIESQQDMASVVDQMVTLKGTISEKDGSRTIVVDSVVQ
jgi:hypothetical protein